MTDTATIADIEAVVAIATGRVVTGTHLAAAGGDLQRAGVNSIGLINVLEALDRRFGLQIGEEEDVSFLATTDQILARVNGTRPLEVR